MSYNSNHYTPRYNSNTSRKLHEQAKKDTLTGQTPSTSTGASSTSNTHSAASGPTTSSSSSSSSRIRDKSSTSGVPAPGHGRRDYYIGGGYASSTASSRSRYNDSYNSSKPPAGSRKEYRGNASGPSLYYGSSSTSQASRRSGGVPPLHRYGSSSKYASDASSGEKFISRSGTSGVGKSSPTVAAATLVPSGFRDERRAQSGMENSSSTPSNLDKETEPTFSSKVSHSSSKMSPSASEPFISTTSKNLKGNVSRKSSFEHVKQRSISNSGVGGSGTSSILDISRRDSARDDERKDTSNAKQNIHESSHRAGSHKESESHSKHTDSAKAKKEAISMESDSKADAKIPIHHDEKLEKKGDHKDTSSDSSKDLQKEKPDSTDSKPTELQSSPPSSASSSSLSSSTGMRKTSLSDYLKKSKVKKKAIDSAAKSEGKGDSKGDKKEDPAEHDKPDTGLKLNKTDAKMSSPDEDSKPPVVNEKPSASKSQDVANDVQAQSDEKHLEQSVTKADDEKVFDVHEHVDVEMKDVADETKNSLLKPETGPVEANETVSNVPPDAKQTPEPLSTVKTENSSKSESRTDNGTETSEKNDIVMTPRTKLSRSDSFTDDMSMLSPVNESELDTNFSFNDIGTMPEIPEETEIAKENKDLQSVLSEVAEAEEPASVDERKDKDQLASLNGSEEEDLSEAETIIGTPPAHTNQGVKLLKKKSNDSDRHNLKKKKMVISSSEEEDNADEEADASKSDKQTVDDGSDDEAVKKDATPEPKRTFSEQKSKKFVTGKAMKKQSYKIKRDSSGRSLLQRACKKGNIDDVRDYLNRGASANEKDFCGFTCLHEAALEGHNEIVQLLIDHGANVNAKADEAGDCETPLIDAAENMHLETVKILLKNHADPTIFNLDGFTALTKIYNEHADEEGYEDIIKVLEDATNKFTNRKAVVSTSQSGQSHETTELEIVDDPNEFYFAGLIKRKGIFKWAAENRKEVVASHFVAGNSLEDKPDILIIAARNGHSELIDIILGLNPTAYNIDTESKCGVTALLASVGRGHFEVVQSLLSKGADPFKTRKKDGFTALQIIQHSAHFDPREVEIIQDAMEKKSGTKIISAVPSRIVSRTTSRAPSVPVSDDESDEEEEEEEKDEVMQDESKDGSENKKDEAGARFMDKDDSMDIDEPANKENREDAAKKESDEKVHKRVIHEEKTKKTKSDFLHQAEAKGLSKTHDTEVKKRKHDHDHTTSDHSLKRAKSESSIKPVENKHHRSSTAVFKTTPSDSVVPKLHNETYEKSISPNTVTPSHSHVNDVKHKAHSPSPSPQASSLSAAAIEEQKIKSAEEARIWQEKVEAKKRARKEMFLKLEKEKELKKKEEEEKKLEQERELAQLKRERELKLAQELERKSKAVEAKKAAMTQKRMLDYYPIGLRKLKLNSEPTDASIAKYLPFYVFVINDVEYVLDLQISLLTLTKVTEFESELEETSLITVESSDKVKLWKLFYKFIGIDRKLKTASDIIKNRKQGEALFDNLLMKFIPYKDIQPILERKFPQVYQQLSQSKPVVVLLDSLQGFDDLTNATINESMDQLGGDDVDLSVSQLSRFIPPHLSYRKDIIKTVKAACNPLW
ncbi:hypothetical protein I9W82_000318 [Candida metapsilosis]|uniref:Hos4 protein n=1 Tax=Candida metapsilosis TaxID=273372 RepID=A0A8H7ZGB5_9ASCO|nr:hypothetical protein I9W82_000318 [Candida metapsilosis]